MKRFFAGAFFYILLVQPSGAQALKEYSVATVKWTQWDDLFGKNSAKVEMINAGSFTPEGSQSTLLDDPAGVKVLDVDGDGESDIIHQGAEAFSIFLNRNDTFEQVAAEDQKIISMSRKWPGSPIIFQTIDWNCCSDNDVHIHSYQYFIHEETLAFHVERTEVIRAGMSDLYNNMPPTDFRTTKAEVSLLAGPASEKVLRTYGFPHHGYAVASIKSDTGKVWWKVYIKEEGYLLRMGWVDREHVLTDFQNR